MAAELGQQTVELSTLVTRAAHDSYASLKELVDKCRSSELSDTDKKISILKFLSKTQQRMIRLNVLSKWCQQVPLIQHCQQLASTVSNHDMCFTQAADSLFFMHEGLQQARAPVYDVPSAIDILLTGSYQRLPKCVEDVGTQYALTEDQQKPALKKLDTLVRSKLLQVSIPKEFSDIKVSDGTAMLRVVGEFKVLITLGYRGHLSLWRILHLELLVGEKNKTVKLEEMRRHVLGDDLERRMAAAENPFSVLYSVLHELCVALVMDTVIRQVQVLRQGRWKDAIRFELISEGHGASSSSAQNPDGESESSALRTPGLKIVYWLDFDKSANVSESGTCPFIKIEPGSDLQIKCLHSSFVIDPLTGKEAEFVLDQSCIDVERLLLRAICCNKYTRLLEIKRELVKNVQVCRTVDDVVLQSRMGEPDIEYKQKDDKCCSKDSEGHEVLCVRAYGSSFFTLGINIRNGRFLLQSSQNIVVSSALIECEEALNQGSMTAAEVFISLRSKSILHLFASIGRVLGLEVYEHGFNIVKIPKDASNGSAMLVMGFPDCGSSYFLLMQLDKDFKPLFKLLETQPDPSGTDNLSGGDLNQVLRIKKIDIGQMQVHEDEMNLSLVDWGKLRSVLPNAIGPNQTSAHEFFSDIRLENSVQIARGHPSGFSSLVDEVFGLEKGSSVAPLSVQNVPSSGNTSLPSQYGSVPMNIHSLKAGSPSPKWEGGMQMAQVNNVTKASGATSLYSGSLFSSGSVKGPVLSSSVGSIPTGHVRNTAGKKLSASKSEQDLASPKSPHSVDISSSIAIDEEQLRVLNDTSNEALSGSRSSRLLSPPRPTGSRMSIPNSRPNGPQADSFKVIGSASCATTPVSQTLESTVSYIAGEDVTSKNDKKSRKRTASDMLTLIPSLQGVENNPGICKRRKISDSSGCQLSLPQGAMSAEMIPKTEGYSYGSLIAEVNKGTVPSSIYIASLLHVVRHCSLCIKHARLTSQMDALDISYVEEVGLRSGSSNIWFRLPLARGDSWQHICLRLGRPGCMYWDVKINDQHFRDLWELQKGSNNTPWGSGVRIANTSDIDSHIHYDPDGVVLSYQSVEVDSIKKLVADIQRLANARTFALGMRKLLGVRAEEKSDELVTSTDSKIPSTKVASDTADKLSEQMRRAFRIEAVGLMSLWFSFGSSVLARFVVEWESGKEGCTMHVSPDQLWPHTKFLEDFINGAEVSSLLDCIRLTAGPLHALAAATRPARAGPVPGVAAALSSIPKQSGGYISSLQLLHRQQDWQESPEGQKMLEFRRTLPAFKEKDAFLRVISENQVVVVSGETGCGKTTQLPQYILESETEAARGAVCNIICTQPRRISAMSVSERVAAERGEKLGESVGYKVRLEGMKGRDTRLLFCTTGVLLRRLLVDGNLKGVTHVIVDEIHERGMNEDFLLIVLKELLPRRPDLRLILMSATLNAELFSSYFNGAPTMHIPGFTFPVRAHFLEEILERTGHRLTPYNQIDDYGQEKTWKMQKQAQAFRKRKSQIASAVEDALEVADFKRYSLRTQDSLSCWCPDSIGFNLIEHVLCHIVKNERPGAVLVFMTGWDDINSLKDQLQAHPLLGDQSRVLLLACHGSMASSEQRLIFENPEGGVRKIVLATNMAETSITINDVVFVVDSGKAKETSYDALNNTPCLLPSWISKAAARQRRGRAGRVQPGECYHLYPRCVYDAFADYQMPELLRTPLQSLCLQIKTLQLGSISEFLSRALQPPEPLSVENAVEYLKIIGALDGNENLTVLGQKLAMLPVEPKLGKMLILGTIFKCLDPIMTVVAGLSVRDPFVMPSDKKDLAESAKSQFAGREYSDHLALVRAFEGWKDAETQQAGYEYCWRNFLSSQTLKAIESLRKQFLYLLKDIGLVNNTPETYNAWSREVHLIRAVICAGLFPGISSVVNKDKSIALKTMEDGQVLLYSSSVNGCVPRIPYPWLVFNEKVKVNSVFLRDSSGISDSALLLFGGNVSRGGLDGHLKMLGGYLEFFMKPELAKTYLSLKTELEELIQKKLLDPTQETQSHSQLLSAVRLLVSEDRCDGRFVFGRQVPSQVKKETNAKSGVEGENFKNKLQTFLNRAGHESPTYKTKQLNNYQFRSTVIFNGLNFAGQPCSSKKLAEKSAAAEALLWLKGDSHSSDAIDHASVLLKKSNKKSRKKSFSGAKWS